jgi:two-component system LytT family response regulator
VDDAEKARATLRLILAENFPQVTVLAEAPSVPDAVKAINKHKPDLVFLDVEMPGYSGLEILDFFDAEQVDFQIIFITAYTEYAVNAFELSAIDYLLKPIKIPQLERAILRASKLSLRDKLQEKQAYANLKEQWQNPDDAARKIALRTAEGLHLIPVNDIIYLKADGSYTTFVLNYPEPNNKIVVSKSISEYERLQSNFNFMRVHRSYMINLNYIKMHLKRDGGFLIMSNNDELPVSNDRKQGLLDYLKQYD